jgi:hypothetical protein
MTNEDLEDLLLALYVQLSRVYDMLVIIADGVGKGEEALEIRDLHADGKILTPPPYLSPDEGDLEEGEKNV